MYVEKKLANFPPKIQNFRKFLQKHKEMSGLQESNVFLKKVGNAEINFGNFIEKTWRLWSSKSETFPRKNSLKFFN